MKINNIDICRDIYALIKSNLPYILSLRNTREKKEDGTFISQGDLLSQKLIIEYLERCISDVYIVSEESYETDVIFEDKSIIVTIDPIDGTENFVSGLKEWGIGVSVYKDMKHFQSMIFLPELDLSFFTGDKLTEIFDSRILGLSSYMTPADFIDLPLNVEYRVMGCCIYNMYNVITGSYYSFFHKKGAYSWDILPGINLALEHNLKVTVNGKTYTGEFLLPGEKYFFEVSRN